MRTGERRGVAAVVDVRNLCRGEGDDLVAGVMAKEGVEVVEVSAGRASDDDFALNAGKLFAIIANRTRLSVFQSQP